MRAWLALTAGELRSFEPADVAGRLAVAGAERFRDFEKAQRDAWIATADCLQRAQLPASWLVLFEFDLLRLEKRIDAIVLTDRAIVVIECKNGASGYTLEASRQATDYALDLYDFHQISRGHPIVPMVLVPSGRDVVNEKPLINSGVLPTYKVNGKTLGPTLHSLHAWLGKPNHPLDAAAWIAGLYRPVPTVLEAAAMLFDRHRSEEMRAARADAANLNKTADAIREAVNAAEHGGYRCVVFVTGIPGAGKTLCGMEVAFSRARDPSSGGAIFLTGNIPLVEVLRADLVRRRAPPKSSPEQRMSAKKEARTILQNMHRFLEDNAKHPENVAEARLVVFDEAQRAWDVQQATRDTQRRRSHLSMSEPAHTIEIMGRHDGWAVIVALIGNGQEINTGEAGLAEWGRAIAAAPGWRAIASPRCLTATTPMQRLSDDCPDWLELDPRLDLTVPMRSVRSPTTNLWVDAVLTGNVAEAAAIAAQDANLPFFLTRDLDVARAKLRELARGFRRTGFVASSGARRLRADGLGVQLEKVEHWFLNRWPDVRSSEALETYATEYACQGLELDVVGLAWGGDFRHTGCGWTPWRFHGDAWQLIRGAEEATFIRNTYRVLMTRARYESVLWIPGGSAPGRWFDQTRDPSWLDATAEFLFACGAKAISSVAVDLEPFEAAENERRLI